MDIDENRKNYEKLGAALQAMIKKFDPHGSPENLHPEIDRILDLAEKIGDPLQEDAAELKKEYENYLNDSRYAESFLKRALRLEQETREI